MKPYKLILIFTLSLFLFSPVSAQLTKQLVILQTSDTHSQIDPINQKGDRDHNLGGAARRAALIEKMRKSNPDLLLVDCGDFCQGTPYYNLFKGNAEIDMMNQMKYDVATIGNHEFDFGLDNMLRIFKRAKFPIVCANYDVSNTVLKDIVKPYVIIKRDGLRIGVFGLGTKLEGMVQAKNYGAMVYNDPTKVANATASQLRNIEKCDVVVCLSHLGIYEDRKMIPHTRGIDIILGGHSHTFMNSPETFTDADGKLVKVMHTGARGVKVGKLVMTLEVK